MTLRHDTAPLHTQHSAKEYVFRLEQKTRARSQSVVPRPDLTVLRGSTEAAREARTTLAQLVRQDVELLHEGTCAEFGPFRRIVMDRALQVCRPARRSCRKPWLRPAAASAQVRVLNDKCLAVRRRKRQWQLAAQEAPDDPEIVALIEAARVEHRDLKRHQRQLQRSLEKAYWDDLLASHPTQETDAFQFFQTLRTVQCGGTQKVARSNPFSPDDWKEHFQQLVPSLRVWTMRFVSSSSQCPLMR